MSENANFCLKNYSRTSFFVLEHPFLLWSILSCFITSYSVIEHPKNVEKIVIYQKCGCGCEVRPLQIGGAHMCACAPQSGRARCVRATQKTVATHTLEICHVAYLGNRKLEFQ